jgi:K+-transporting ATPase ATPase A chain
VLAPAAAILLSTAIACVTKAGVASVANPGPHGFSEMLYAFTSAVSNNGSAFAGLNANTDFYNYLTALGMFIGRFAVMIPVLAIAGSLAAKKTVPPSAGTFPTDSLTFAGLLIAVVLIVGALTFFPALSLGPVVEHLLAQSGRTF